MSDGRTLLSDEHLEKVAILRINKKLMRYFKTTYPNLIRKKAIEKTLAIVQEHEGQQKVQTATQGKLLAYFKKMSEVDCDEINCELDKIKHFCTRFMFFVGVNIQ